LRYTNLLCNSEGIFRGYDDGTLLSLLSTRRHPRRLTAPIRLAIGCSSYLFGEGLKKLLEGEKGIQHIGILNDGADFKEIVKMEPDIAILDFNIFATLPKDLSESTKIKMLLLGESGMHAGSDRKILNLISNGVVGLVPPGADSFLLKKAIKVVSSGELWLDRKTLSNILTRNGLSSIEKVNLTKAERGVVSLICGGFRNKEIANKLEISEKTVKSHCNRIYKKVGVTDRLQLATHIYKASPDWYLAKT
jgi:DNA-binding NarL/FixJ family response regulator